MPNNIHPGPAMVCRMLEESTGPEDIDAAILAAEHTIAQFDHHCCPACEMAGKVMRNTLAKAKERLAQAEEDQRRKRKEWYEGLSEPKRRLVDHVEQSVREMASRPSVFKRMSEQHHTKTQD